VIEALQQSLRARVTAHFAVAVAVGFAVARLVGEPTVSALVTSVGVGIGAVVAVLFVGGYGDEE
jgi:hypothetical protein